MTRTPIGACAAFLAAVSLTSMAAPPQPQLHVAPNGIKQLRFNWEPVSGATSYELWFQSSAAAAETRFFQMPSSQTSVVNNVAVHLLDWSNSRYWLKACDSSGCTSSSKISPVNQMLGTIGLFKNPAEQGATQFGESVAVSADGTTLAVVAPAEAVNGDYLLNGSIYIWRRSTSGWAFEAQIPLDAHLSGLTNDAQVSLNRTGFVLAVALPSDSEYSGPDGANHGLVKVFRKFGTDKWRHDDTIAPGTSTESFAASWMAIDDAGTTLAMKGAGIQGGVDIFTYGRYGTWEHSGSAIGHGEDFNYPSGCTGFALSGDGKVLAFECYNDDSGQRWFDTYAAPDWKRRDTFTVTGSAMFAADLDFTGDLLAATVRTQNGGTQESRVEVWRRVGGAYQLDGTLRRGAWEAAFPGTAASFGLAARFSRDDKLLVVSDTQDHGQGVGSLAPPLAAGSTSRGAVYVWERRTIGWVLRRMVKPGSADAAYSTAGFGNALGLGDNGRTLAVGHSAANSNAGVLWLY